MQVISINDTEEAFSTHIIPIEEDDDDNDDDDDVQFVQESQQGQTMNAAGGPKHNRQQTLPADNTENSTSLDKDSDDDFNMLNVETVRNPNKDKFTCQICSRTFYHKGTLTHHMKLHKSNFCNICKQHFPHRNKLNSHTCVPPVPSQRVSKSCELCGKTFANPSALRIHYVVHTGEKPYRCSLCGKGFTQKGNLKCHLRIHTGERPFRCIRCGKTFTQKVNLNHHLMAHRNREVVGETPIARRHVKNLMAETCQ
ncbi:gastrula zinc finger protein XlCGF49.1-like [Xiphias gladius]|uniref:gastrula zinc finger protein XlCGF49.1-like n=1 Tax=Xiphias gladius TaxID=8245 RepID=UPI001A994522|nr:gastrula zinc finger protein XlCGF49.1-like [Xiphias gladius]